MFIEYIERMRKEPKEVRQRAVVFWTAVLVGLIVVLYLVLRLSPGSTESRDERSTIAAPYESKQ